MSGVAFRVFPKELFWLAPFACLALVAAAAWRPPPVFPTPARTRLITDAKGVKVNVPLPFRTVIRYGGSGFLETTHAPEAVAKAGGNARDRERFGSGIINRFYPRIAKDDALWGCPPEIESLLAIDAGYTYFDGYPELLRRVGLTALSLSWNPANRDEHIFSVTRVEAEAMGARIAPRSFSRTIGKAISNSSRSCGRRRWPNIRACSAWARRQTTGISYTSRG